MASLQLALFELPISAMCHSAVVSNAKSGVDCAASAHEIRGTWQLLGAIQILMPQANPGIVVTGNIKALSLEYEGEERSPRHLFKVSVYRCN